jgi:O-antigen ligase
MTTFDAKLTESIPRRESDWAVARRKDLNGVTMAALLLLLALVPLPFGAVYPFTWGATAVFLGLATILYMVRLSRIGISLRVSLTEMGAAATPFALYCLYLVLQVLPIGLLLPGLTSFEANGMSFSSPTLSVASDQTVLMLVRHLTYGLLFFLVVQVTQNPDRRQFFIKAMLAIIALYCAEAVVSLQAGDTLLGLTKHHYLGSATGPFVNRNSFATFLAIGAVIALAQVGNHIVRQTTRHQHDGIVQGVIGNIVLYGALYLVLFAVVFATNSRMGVFCAVSGSAVVIAVVFGRLARFKMAVIPLLVAILAASVVGLVLFGEALFNRTIDIEASTDQRIELYRQIWQLITMRPLTGFGGGSFEQAYQIVHQLPVSADVAWNRAHNSYLSLWSEMGLIVGSLPVIALLLVGVRLIGALRHDTPAWAIQATGLAVLVIAGIHSLVDFSLEIQANAMFFVALVAAAVGSTYGRATSRR